MSKNPVVHFEMPYKDAKRVKEFYKQAFGWGMNDTGEDMGGYVVAQTAETDENQMVKTPGTINGGFYDLNMAQASPQPSVVISVDDLDQAMQAIKDAGGEVLSEPQEIPGIGMWAVFKDSEGNRVSILQPNR
jgi:predicted enzyme related to lactoylglutathione lyase